MTPDGRGEGGSAKSDFVSLKGALIIYIPVGLPERKEIE